MAANTLTGLVPIIYEALDVVSRELAGFALAVNRDVNTQRVALNQVVRSPVTPALASQSISPANIAPDTTGSTVGTVDLTITKAKAVPFNFSGEEVMSLTPPVAGTAPYDTIRRDVISQAIRTLVNEAETDLANEAYVNASRYFGTAGTTPFGTAADLSDAANVLKILQDNGCPITPGDLRLILNTTASANLRGKQPGLFRVNESGTDNLLRNGILGSLYGFNLGESAALTTKTKGTGSAYTTSAAGFAVGTTSIPIITGTGTVLAGDVITFAGDTNKYTVVTGVSAPGTIVIAAPGLRQAIPASATALTIGNNYTPSVAFHRSALQLAWRQPALPVEGDQAADRMTIIDPYTGLAFEFAVYLQYRQVRYEIAAAWGVKAVKPAHIAGLLG